MTNNPILEELYAVRREILNKYGDDLGANLHSEFERLKASGHPIATIKQRTVRCTKAAKPADSATESQPSRSGDP